MTYEILDSVTGMVVKTGLTLRGAHKAADRMDNAYGAVRYIVRRAA